jgi:ketosteroid isomerase-like protein
MSQENVDSFKRASVHFERRDVEGVLEELDPQVEWYPAFTALVGGEKSMYRGHDGARELMQEYWDVFSEAHFSVSEIRDLGDQVLAIGTMRVRGAESGADIESPWAWLVRSKQGKAVSVRAYTDPAEALEAAGKKLQKRLKKAKEAKNKQKVKKIRKKMRKLDS